MARDPSEARRLARRFRCQGAVSYTHLRAHETVLDLVCRLLLEKKNNNRTHDVIVVLAVERTVDRSD